MSQTLKVPHSPFWLKISMVLWWKHPRFHVASMLVNRYASKIHLLATVTTRNKMLFMNPSLRSERRIEAQCRKTQQTFTWYKADQKSATIYLHEATVVLYDSMGWQEKMTTAFNSSKIYLVIAKASIFIQMSIININIYIYKTYIHLSHFVEQFIIAKTLVFVS